MQYSTISIICVIWTVGLTGQVPGTPDTDFGGNQTGFNQITINGYSSALTSVMIDSSSRVVGAGYVSDTSAQLVVIRFTSQGELDTTFGNSSGYTLVALSSNSDVIHSAVLKSDNSIVVGGFGGNIRRALIAQFTSQGLLDTTFGESSGYTLLPVAGNNDARITAISLDKDGKIVVCGVIDGSGSHHNKSFIMRFTSNGILDTSFGSSNGYTLFSLGDEQDVFEALVLDDQDRIIVVGHTSQVASSGVLIVRFSNNGLLDTNFGDQSGYTLVDIGGSSQTLLSVGIDCMDQLIAIGTGGSNEAALVIRFTSDGALDTTFGSSNGYTLVNIGNSQDYLTALSLDSAHNILGVGKGGSNDDVLVIRFNPNGLLDTQFGGNDLGYHLYDLGGVDEWRALALTNQGNFVVGGDGASDVAIGQYIN